MTKEDAMNVLKEHIDTYVICHGEEDTVAVSLDNVDIEALDMAINALEQEPVLDKIRSEIDRQEKWLLQAGCTAYNVDIALDAIKSAVGRSDVSDKRRSN